MSEFDGILFEIVMEIAVEQKWRLVRFARMTEQTGSTSAVTDPEVRHKLRIVRILVGMYAALSVLTLLAIIVFSGDPDIVTDDVWVRGVILVIISLVTVWVARSMAKGSRSSYRRVRIISIIQIVAIIVIDATPGSFPAWFKIENGVCGILLIIVVLVTFSAPVRAAFADR